MCICPESFDGLVQRHVLQVLAMGQHSSELSSNSRENVSLIAIIGASLGISELVGAFSGCSGVFALVSLE